MLGRLFKKAAAARPIDTARVPDGMRVYAIGDVHGRADLLHELLLKIEDDSLARGAADTHIIFLGDLMDRGPDSAGVIETAMALRAAGRKVRFLMGNHEEVFLRACRKNDAKITRFFIRIGGEATVLSYPITRAEYMALDMHELSERLQTLVPQLYEADANIDYRPLSNLLVPLPWHKGRIVLIGDTVHATTPHLASGAGIGIESAIVLAED